MKIINLNVIFSQRLYLVVKEVRMNGPHRQPFFKLGPELQPTHNNFHLKIRSWFAIKVDSWVIRPYRHPSTKTGRSRRYPNRFSSGLEGGQFMKLFVGWYPFKLWNKY